MMPTDKRWWDRKAERYKELKEEDKTWVFTSTPMIYKYDNKTSSFFPMIDPEVAAMDKALAETPGWVHLTYSDMTSDRQRKSFMVMLLDKAKSDKPKHERYRRLYQSFIKFKLKG